MASRKSKAQPLAVSRLATSKTKPASGSDGAAKRSRGRPRSADADQAIFAAAIELLSSRGLHQLSMEAVAEKAGVGKATLYRRFASKRDLVEAALRTIRSVGPAPDTGTVRGDLGRLIKREIAASKRIKGLERFAPRLLADAADDPELSALAHETVLTTDRGRIDEVLRRGVERGELRDDLDLELAIDLLHGALIYRFLLSGEGARAITASYVEKLLSLLETGLASRK